MSTPALDRATEEVRQQDAAGPLMRTSVPTRTRAHAIVSAALHDPADPDWLAREYVARLAHESWDTGCQRVCFHAAWDDMAEPDRNVIRAQVDAVRAAILGSPS